MTRTVALLSLLALSACDLPGEAPRVYPKPVAYGSCRTVDKADSIAWANCMVGHAPKNLRPGYEMETTADSYMLK
jgi:hypothetical protein